MIIRDAAAADAAEIERMIRDLVVYEGNTRVQRRAIGGRSIRR